jgi:hypothetical protein
MEGHPDNVALRFMEEQLLRGRTAKRQAVAASIPSGIE